MQIRRGKRGGRKCARGGQKSTTRVVESVLRTELGCGRELCDIGMGSPSVGERLWRALSKRLSSWSPNPASPKIVLGRPSHDQSAPSRQPQRGQTHGLRGILHTSGGS
jgi:hypothetical protein